MPYLTIPEAQERLQQVAHIFQEARASLCQVWAAIPPSEIETSDEDMKYPLDEATHIRTTVMGDLQEYLEPLIRNLKTAATYSMPPREPPANPLDLGKSEKEIAAAVEARVVFDWFTPEMDEDEPDGYRLPPTPDEARLQVFKVRDHWYATWRHSKVPSEESWERLRLTEDPQRPGRLVYTEAEWQEILAS